MSGVNAISMIKYSYMMNGAYQDKSLTAETRAKLIALGINVSGIKTEAEGRIKLQAAQLENNSGSNKVSKSANQEDNLLERAKSLADDLGISVSDFDNINDIVAKIKDKIEELKADAGEDFDKKSNVNYYEDELSGIEQSQMTMIDLTSSMDFTATMNMAFHGLY